MENPEFIELSLEARHEVESLFNLTRDMGIECSSDVGMMFNRLSGLIQNPIVLKKEHIVTEINYAKENLDRIPPIYVERYKNLLQKVVSFAKDHLMEK